jgi:hypothetical protein
MKRTKTNKDKIWWIKKGGGSFRMKSRVIKPNQKFQAFPHEIPQGFRDNVIPLEKYEEVEETFKAPPLAYTAKKREKSNWYDVFDGQGKKVNEKALSSRQKALDFIKSLE